MAEAMENVQSFEPSPQEKAIRNALIFDCILSKMDLDGLKLLRRVCKSWELAANSEMLKRPGNKVEFVWCCEKKYADQCPALTKETKKKPKYLSDLNKILKTSKAFPCRHFVFQNGNMDNLTCKNFFRIQGKQIETLIMNNLIISKDTFIHMVNEEMPNLKELSFVLDLDTDNSPERKVMTWERNPSKVIEFKLPSLEILHVECHMDDYYVRQYLLKQMIYAAPKLKSAGNISFRLIDGQFWEEKAHVIKECSLYPWDLYPQDTKLEDLQRFVKAKPMLHTLKITKPSNAGFKDPLMMQLMAQLLQACSETLKKLETDSLSTLPIDSIMNSLTNLYLIEAKRDGPFPAAAPAKFFPRLEYICFGLLYSCDREVIEDYFKMATDSPSLISVKHLFFHGGLRESTTILPGINSLFPNLINLSMKFGAPSDESYVSEIFEKLEKLKWIKLSAHTQVSKEEWYKAVSDGKAKDLLKVAHDDDQKAFWFAF